MSRHTKRHRSPDTELSPMSRDITGHLTRAGTGIQSPAASNAPARCRLHPAARNVPDRATRDGACGRTRHPRERCLMSEPGLVGVCIGIRRRAVAEPAPTADPMSKLDTKGFAGLKRAKRNRMIPRFRCKPEEREASFVSDLDTTRPASRDLSGDAGGNSNAGDASSPSERRDPAVARTRPARVATVRTRLRH